jgi:hypothetical protein
VNRRDFLASTLGASLVTAADARLDTTTQGTAPTAPQLYVWRQYIVRAGTQPRRLAEFMQAAIPALNRLGHRPIGVFEVVAGVPSPSLFVLTPVGTADRLPAIESGLEKDDAFMRAAEPYFAATAADPVYMRQEAALLRAFRSMPAIEIPAATATKGPRLFELRTYESHNERAHLAKVRMFDEMGEIAIFRRCGLTPVFFARTLVGPRMPNLVYMLVHENQQARDKSWDAFRTDPEWKKLAATPGYTDPEIVSNITTVLLRPSGYSQI